MDEVWFNLWAKHAIVERWKGIGITVHSHLKLAKHVLHMYCTLVYLCEGFAPSPGSLMENIALLHVAYVLMYLYVYVVYAIMFIHIKCVPVNHHKRGERDRDQTQPPPPIFRDSNFLFNILLPICG